MFDRIQGAVAIMVLAATGAGATEGGRSDVNALPVAPAAYRAHGDWLVTASTLPARIFRSADGKELILTNGLVARTFRLGPNLATVGLDQLSTTQSLLRAVKPEATVEIDGRSYDIGGLKGQPDLAYLRPEWLNSMAADPEAFHFTGFDVSAPRERFGWKRSRPCPDAAWPPAGTALTLHFAPPVGRLPGVSIDVHYELYTGLPLFAKWISIRNGGDAPIRLNRFRSEVLGLVEYESIVDSVPQWQLPQITVTSDYAFGGMSVSNSSKTTYWTNDPDYGTQVNYELKTPAVLESRPPVGPDKTIAAGDQFESFVTFELLHDSSERERKGMAVRRMFRTVAPWVTENPLMLHLTSVDPRVVHTAIDQCAELGFEMVIFSFGSGLNMEDDSAANIAKFRDFVQYAHGKGVQIGGYSLLASRRIDDDNDVINPATGKTGGAIFGNSPCLGSKWGVDYFRRLKHFLSETGFDLLEHDGSYPGDLCASTTHPGHHGVGDSQWEQWKTISDFYKWCRSRGIFLNVPDHYFLSGSNKTGMGYRETNWSLPRAEQHIHARQNIYDGTWEKTPSMGWMFTPLVEYQGGGPAATIEPLHDHLTDYEMHLANNLGAGVQACYRGPRLYDSPETRDVVKRWVTLFKRYRRILESDIVHLRRADARDLDGILHVNPTLSEKGFVVVYNPTATAIARSIRVPLRYTGIARSARVEQMDGARRSYKLDREGSIDLEVNVPAHGLAWYVVR